MNIKLRREYNGRERKKEKESQSQFMASPLVLILLFTCFPASHADELFLPVRHSLAGARFNFTQHLLKSTSARSATRFLRYHRHHHLSSSAAQGQVSLPLSPGSDYTISLTIASRPPQPISLYMDTGSDLVWFPCLPFTCILCDGKPKPQPATIKFSSSTSIVSCQSSFCSAAHSSASLSSSDLCAVAHCPLELIETSDCASFPCPSFYYAYGDGSFTARLRRHTVSIPMSSPPLVLPNFTFGCAHFALGEPVGVAGFGRGVLSLPAQLSKLSTPQLGSQFSYCLVSHSFNADRINQPSPLILGQSESRQKSSGPGRGDGGEFVFTPMLDNSRHPYLYSVGLEGISVGKNNIPAPRFLKEIGGKGNGGMVVDSGTTFTMLPAALYNSVVAEFDCQLGRLHKRAKEIEAQTGLSPCYYIDNMVEKSNVPTLTLHFTGYCGNISAVQVLLPRTNYFYEFMDESGGARRRRVVGCLMVMNGGDEADLEGGPWATLGNYQQQGFEVVYDLEKKRIGFARRNCSSLWDSLKRR